MKAELVAGARLWRSKITKGVKGGAKFVAEPAPRIIAKYLLRASARKAARRALSLVPLAGWGFAGKDAYAGVEAILRGNTARGMAAIGLAVGDVASDVLHLGDAVSGVGGTALSIAAQSAAIAGQVKIEMDRIQEKMEELNREIERNDALPGDGRLRDHYDLDDEAIAELRKQFVAPETREFDESDLPPPPAWTDDPPENEMPPATPMHPPPAPRAPPVRWVDQPIG